MRLPILLTVVLLLVSAPAVAQRTLYWSDFDVTAALDADGRLRVLERQTMVFDGPWNGGERTFLLGFAQDLTIHGIYRVDVETGERVKLQLGNLAEVDHWEWATGESLRWRSRLPSDPPFDNQELIYELDYTLTGVLIESGNGYRMAHDFAFPNRVGVIESFSLELEIDPAWQSRTAVSQSVEIQSLPPGEGAVISATFDYVGSGEPAATVSAVSLEWRLAIFTLALASVAFFYLRFRRHEHERGRDELSDVPNPVDRTFLEEHLFDRRAEVIGALWDRKIGPPEVAATIARMVSEGKLESEVHQRGRRGKRQVLALELLADRGDLEGYERSLINKLFFGGRTETDTDAIRKHYKSKGFNPTSVIRSDLEERLDAVYGERPAKPKGFLAGGFILGVAALLGLEGATRGESALIVMALLLITAMPAMVFGWYFAYLYRKSNLGLRWKALGFLIPLVLSTLGIVFGVFAEDLFGAALPDFFPGIFGILALAVAPSAVAALLFHLAEVRDSRELVRERRRLAEIRRHFIAELDRPEPVLEDGWFPYLLAFGLEKQVDRWFASFGGASTGHDPVRSFGSVSGSAGSSGWTGGGGAFGGAGATAGWAVAATGMAATVAAPSSSGSSGGFSGGGSFSGGGGGGGW